MRHVLNGAVGQSGNKTTYFHCGKCDQVVSEKYAINHPKGELDYLFSVEDEELEKKKPQEHEERKKKVEEVEGVNEEEIKKQEEKDKKIQAYRAEIKDLDDDELNDLLESLKAEIETLKDQLKDLPDEEKQSKQASLEYLGVDTYHSVGTDGDNAFNNLVAMQNQRIRKKKLKISQTYSVLTLDQNHHESKRGDELLIKQGSSD